MQLITEEVSQFLRDQLIAILHENVTTVKEQTFLTIQRACLTSNVTVHSKLRRNVNTYFPPDSLKRIFRYFIIWVDIEKNQAPHEMTSIDAMRQSKILMKFARRSLQVVCTKGVTLKMQFTSVNLTDKEEKSRTEFFAKC